MIDYTVDVLVDQVRTTASIPTAQPRFDDSGIVDIMTRILQSKIVPMIMAVREEYFVTFKDYTIIQGNTTGYAIPKNAIGMKLRAVVLVNQSGVLNLTALPRLSIEQVAGYYFGQVVPFGFYVQNNNVILWPPNQTTPSNTLRMYFLNRPNVLTLSINCSQVDIVIGNEVTLNTNLISSWDTDTVLNSIDSEPGFNTNASGIQITAITGLNSFTVADPTGIGTNDYLALDGFSPIAQVPVEVQQLLVQETALEILKSLGDSEGYQKLEVEMQQMTKFAQDVLSPRADGNPKKAISAGNAIADWCGFRWRS